MTRFGHSMMALALVAVPSALLAPGCGPTYPNCDNDEQCHEGEFCVNGHCEDCRDDSHCPEGQQCDSGACAPIPGWCNSDSMCASDEMCDLATNRCVPRPVETVETVEGPPPPCELEAAYFGFDADTLDATATAALDRDRACITERGYTGVTITGMCDPRGTEEYNMALGDRRARAVRDHLQRLGVDRRTMSTRSVGEEMASGSDEYSWSRDRRADLAPR
jgi:peptidoglycan-associated lipoprotein